MSGLDDQLAEDIRVLSEAALTPDPNDVRVEAAARAIADAEGCDEQAWRVGANDYRTLARAALAAADEAAAGTDNRGDGQSVPDQSKDVSSKA